jgi:hypothetical protein
MGQSQVSCFKVIFTRIYHIFPLIFERFLIVRSYNMRFRHNLSVLILGFFMSRLDDSQPHASQPHAPQQRAEQPCRPLTDQKASAPVPALIFIEN